MTKRKHSNCSDQSYQTEYQLSKKHWTEELAHNTPNEGMFERSLDDIKKELNEEYPKLIKSIQSKKLTQAQKKEVAMEYTDLLEEFVEAYNKVYNK
jgi:hypothetical protein